MRKRIFSLLIAFFLVAFCGVSAFALEGEVDYQTAVEDELFSVFDNEITEALSLFGIDGLESGSLNFSVESLSHYFSTNLKEKAESALSLFLELFSLLLCVGLIETLAGKEKSDLLSLLGVCAFSVLAAQKTFDLLNVAATAAEGINKLMLSFVPIYGGIIAVGGNPMSAAAYDSLTLFLAQLVSLLTSKFVVPFVGVILCFTVAFSMSRVVNCSRFLSAAGKISNFVLGFAAACFTGFLSLKGILASSSDGASAKTVRFLVSSLVPVVGGAMSDAYSAFFSSINLIKSSVAVVGMTAIVIACMPAIIELLLNFTALSLLSFASELLNREELTQLFRGFSLSLKLLSLVLVYEMFILVISTGLMLNIRGTV